MPPNPSKFEAFPTPKLERDRTFYETYIKVFGALAVGSVALGAYEYVNHAYPLTAMNVLNVALCVGLVRHASQNGSLVQQELNKRIDQDGRTS